MYSEALEIVGVGVGMVFLALIVILLGSLALRAALERGESRSRGAIPTIAPRDSQSQAEEASNESDRPAPCSYAASAIATKESFGHENTAKAAAIAMALYMFEATRVTSPERAFREQTDRLQSKAAAMATIMFMEQEAQTPS